MYSPIWHRPPYSFLLIPGYFIHSHGLAGPYGPLNFQSKGKICGGSIIYHLTFEATSWSIQHSWPIQSSVVTHQCLFLCMFPVICHRALLLDILRRFFEKLNKDRNNSINIFVENIGLEVKAYIFGQEDEWRSKHIWIIQIEI